PRDGKAELEVAGGEPQIAGGGNGRGPARADAGDGGDGGHRARLDLLEHPLHARLVGEAVCRPGLKVAKERDVRPGAERAPAGTRNNEGPERAVGADAGADLAETVVHLEGQRIVCRRPVERNDADGPLDLPEQLAPDLVLHCLCALRLSCDECRRLGRDCLGVDACWPCSTANPGACDEPRLSSNLLNSLAPRVGFEPTISLIT